MNKAHKSNQDLVIDIISESFIENPSVLNVIKDDHHKNRRLHYLAKYAFRTALRREGVYISSDKTGAAICYKYNLRKESLYDYWNQLILAIKCISLGRVVKILKRESYIKKQRPESGEYLYFWFLGVKNNSRGKGAAKELKDEILDLSNRLNLPIFLETSVEQNRIVYERYGFQVYHIWDYQKEGIKLFFMKREPKTI